MKRLLTASIVAAAFASSGAAAQEYAPYGLQLHELCAPNDDARLQADAWKRWADDFSREMRTSMSSMFAHRVVSQQWVKGAPYSARIVTELNQPLPDGNVISHRHEGAVYRDSEGRTRQESIAEGGTRSSIVIVDPVEQKHYMLMPESKRAIEMRAKVKEPKVKNKQVVKVDGREIRVEDGKVFIDGRESTGSTVLKSRNGKEIRIENGKVTIDGKDAGDITPGSSGTKVIINRSDDGAGGREEVRVQVVRAGDDAHIPVPPIPPIAPPAPVSPTPGQPGLAPLPPMPPIPGVQTMRFESMGRLGQGTTTSLGAKEIEGVRAEGKKTTWTIPAGEIGNRNPITVTSESWYSPDLQVTVYSRYNDPRTGESIYRLAGIKRGEPSPDLFKVPADYNVRSRMR